MMFRCDGCNVSCYVAFATDGEPPKVCVNTGTPQMWMLDDRVEIILHLRGKA